MVKNKEVGKVGNYSAPEAKPSLEGFEDLEAGAEQLIVGVWGRSKSKKTSLAYTFPDPIYHIVLGDRDPGPLKKWFNDKSIKVKRISVPPDEDLDVEAAGEVFKEFLTAYKGALGQPQGTVVVDTVSRLWTIISIYALKSAYEVRAAAYEEKKAAKKDAKEPEVYQFDYSDANWLYERTFELAEDSRANKNRKHVVFVAKAQNEFNGSGQKPQAQKNTEYAVNLWLKADYGDVEFEKTKTIAGKKETVTYEERRYWVEVQGSGWGTEHEGIVIYDPKFEHLLALAKGAEGDGSS